MPNLSVVIITFNEEHNISRCLDSVQDVADEVVVVDSFSSDNTAQICNRYQVNFIQRRWEGYSDTKNFANKQAKHNWILSLDADEALSDALKSSIKKLKENTGPLTCSFNRLTNYCGKWIRHSGWYPDVKIRLFDRTQAQWQGKIHEQLVFTNQSPVLHLTGDCLHYSYYSLKQHREQAKNFSTLWANARFSEGHRSSVLKMIYKPIATFLKAYVFHLGFLDGSAGFSIARISSWATYLRYSLLFKLQNE